MPFNFLLWNCLERGTTIKERKKETARLDREKGECVLAFRLEPDRFRKEFGAEGDKVCDGLFFYWAPKRSPVVIFVELKRSHIGDAADQLGATIERLRIATPDYRPKCLAVIVTKGGVPTEDKDLRSKFMKKHNVPLNISKDGNLRPFLKGA